MSTRTIILLVAILSVLALASIGIIIARHGFSAREKPSRLEEFLARQARRIATPAGAKELKNPYSITSESLAAAGAHWVDHCALCHGLDGRGGTSIGRNLYPPAPDMTSPGVQQLSDGELYYIITNGVRFTGMPAWGGEHTVEETWQQVSFIRRLPNLSTHERKLLEDLASGEVEPHIHAPGRKPHGH